MGSLSRRKGHDFERYLARRFREAMPGAEIKRGLQSREGHEAADVETPVFWVEAKRGTPAYCNPKRALAQALRDAPEGDIPVAVLKEDRKDAIVCLRFDDFLGFVQQWWEGRAPQPKM